MLSVITPTNQQQPKIFTKQPKKVKASGFKPKKFGFKPALVSVQGIIHVKCSFNNTIVTLTDLLGNTKAWASCGSIGFKGAKRSSRFAGQMAIENLGDRAVEAGYSRIILHLNGLGKARNVCIKTLKQSGLKIYIIKDFTSIVHNGCRPSKVRRL